MVRKRTKKQCKNVSYIFLFFLVLFLDQLSKTLIRHVPLGKQQTIIPGILWLTHAQNTGASFSLFTGKNDILLWFSIFVLGLLIYWNDQFQTNIEKTGYVLILAGLFGNLTDRVLFGSVTDMFDLGWFPIFNVADSALVAGVLLLLLYEIFWKKRKRDEEKGKEEEEKKGKSKKINKKARKEKKKK